MLLRRWTGAIVDHPWLTLVAILVVTLFLLSFIPQIRFETDFKKFLPASDPAVERMQQAEKIFGSQEFFMVLLETPDTIFKIPTVATIHEMEGKFKTLRGVDDVIGPTTATVISATEKMLVIESAAEILPSTPEELERYRRKVMGDRNLRSYIFAESEKAAGILLKLNPYLEDTAALVRQVTEIAESYEEPDLRIYVGGVPQLRTSIASSMQEDLKLLMPMVVLVMEFFILLAFRTGRGVALPFLLMTLAVIWTVGTMSLLKSPMTPFSFFLPVMLIIVSKAYAIYTVNRYYEEAMHQGLLAKKEIILNAMQDMSKPLSMDAVTTMAGFLSLLSASLWPQRTFGLFIAIGIFYTLVLNFTLLPAVLALLPISKKQYDYEHGWIPNALVRFGRLIDRRRGWVLAMAGAILIAFALAIPHLRVETTPSEFLGKKHPAMIASTALERHMGGSMQLSILVDTGKPNGLQDPTVLAKLVALQEFLKEQPEYGGSVTSVANIVRELNQKFHADDPSYYAVPDDRRLVAQLLTLFTFSGGDLGTMATPDFSRGEVIARIKLLSSTQIARLSQRVDGYLAQRSQGPEAHLVGVEQAWASLTTRTLPDTARTLLLALAAAFLIVALLLRSLVAALVAASPMILTIVMNLGTMSYLGLPLDLASLMIGSIAVGVGIDYTVNLIIRWRTEVGRGHSLQQAHEITMRTMGRGILFNALTLTAGFAIFYLSNFQGLRNFGLLINLTMIWSFLGSFTLIPALLLALKPRFLTGYRIQMMPETVAAQSQPMEEV